MDLDQFIDPSGEQASAPAPQGIPTHIALGIILGAAFLTVVTLRVAS